MLYVIVGISKQFVCEDVYCETSTIRVMCLLYQEGYLMKENSNFAELIQND